MTGGFLEQVLILLCLKKKSGQFEWRRGGENPFSEEGRRGAQEADRVCLTE